MCYLAEYTVAEHPQSRCGASMFTLMVQRTGGIRTNSFLFGVRKYKFIIPVKCNADLYRCLICTIRSVTVFLRKLYIL